MEIKELKSASTQQITDLQELCNVVYSLPSMLSQEGVSSFLVDDHKKLFVAMEGEKIVGMATVQYILSLRGATAHLDDVAVLGEFQGKGIASGLMTSVIDAARDYGCRAIECTSRPDRTAANALYQKVGFEKRETNVYRLKL
jgi:ribosomal protein S18 acetylase RimI-like enzyme